MLALQKNGGRLGEEGSTKHLFYNFGIIHIDKDKISEEKMLEIAINAGAKDCISLEKVHEIISEKDDFYKVKSNIEKKIDEIIYSAIEWRPKTKINLLKEENQKILEILDTLEDDDDVQNIFLNSNSMIN